MQNKSRKLLNKIVTCKEVYQDDKTKLKVGKDSRQLLVIHNWVKSKK